MINFDVLIIGGGPGGYAMAIQASKFGLRVAIVESEKLGGTCLNKGCIPTKALLHVADVKHLIETSAKLGIKSTIEEVNLDIVVDRACGIVRELNNNLDNLMKFHKIEVIQGIAKFYDKNTVIVNDKDRISAKNIVIATGALPRKLSSVNSDLVWDSKAAMFSKRLPKRLLIVGSGAIGIEFASFYNSFGSEVTIVEIQDRILINEDFEISKFAFRAFEKRGMKLKTNTSVKSFNETEGKQLSVEMSDGTIEVFDNCIVAIGVIPNTRDLNLEKIGVKTTEGGSIIVDKYMETSIKNIYAIGDVVSGPWLAHKASREGIICAERIAGLSNIQTMDYNKSIPSCIYSDPQIASIGMTEQEAKKLDNVEVKIGKSYFKGNGKALAIEESNGFVKVLLDKKTGEILGVHMIGPDVTELIPIFSLAISAELTEKEIVNTVFPHPTLSEVLQDAVINACEIEK